MPSTWRRQSDQATRFEGSFRPGAHTASLIQLDQIRWPEGADWPSFFDFMPFILFLAPNVIAVFQGPCNFRIELLQSTWRITAMRKTTLVLCVSAGLLLLTHHDIVFAGSNPPASHGITTTKGHPIGGTEGHSDPPMSTRTSLFEAGRPKGHPSTGEFGLKGHPSSGDGRNGHPSGGVDGHPEPPIGRQLLKLSQSAVGNRTPPDLLQYLQHWLIQLVDESNSLELRVSSPDSDDSRSGHPTSDGS